MFGVDESSGYYAGADNIVVTTEAAATEDLGFATFVSLPTNFINDS